MVKANRASVARTKEATAAHPVMPPPIAPEKSNGDSSLTHIVTGIVSLGTPFKKKNGGMNKSKMPWKKDSNRANMNSPCNAPSFERKMDDAKKHKAMLVK